MQELEIDFTKAKEGKATAPKLKAGNYIGNIKGLTKKLNDKTGALSVSFKVDVDGETYFSRPFQIGGKDNNFYLLDALNKLEVKVGDKELLDNIEVKGIKAEFSVTEREFNGKTYTDMDVVKGLGKSEAPF